MKVLLAMLLSSIIGAAQAALETSLEAAAVLQQHSQSADEKWFWKKTDWGGLGGGFTTFGNGGGATLGGATLGGATQFSTIFVTSFFTLTSPGSATTQFVTLPGFTATVFASQDPNASASASLGGATVTFTQTPAPTTVFITASAPQLTTLTSFTTLPTTTTIFQS